jgi:hypothetical protein
MNRIDSTRKAWLWALVLLFAIACAGQAAAQAWAQLDPSGGPPAGRGYFSGVYNINSNRMIVFGGSSNGGDLSDAWVLDHADGTGGTPSWMQLAPATAPAAREGHVAVYDTAGNRMIMFGGHTNYNPFFNDVWVLSNADGTGGTPVWTQLVPTGTPPSARSWSSAVYDSVGNLMIVYGGFDGSAATNDVWVLSHANGSGGTPAWTQLSTATSPPARYAHTAVYDAANNRMTVFGAYNFGSELNDVWVLSNANGVGTPAWTQLSPTGTPPSARGFLTATYDPATNRMVVFGGYFTNNETWVLSAADGLGGTPAWTQLVPTGGLPAARFGQTAIYNAANNRMVMFGGYSASFSLLNDTWVLSSASGVIIVPVAIDIRPRLAINPISRTTGTTIPVAILSSANFNALTAVNRTSLTFGRTGTEASLIHCNTVGQDVNADGRMDLVCQFNGTLGGFQMGDSIGYLQGMTLVGNPIQGSDSVLIQQ